jgi:hypothetical protein
MSLLRMGEGVRCSAQHNTAVVFSHHVNALCQALTPTATACQSQSWLTTAGHDRPTPRQHLVTAGNGWPWLTDTGSRLANTLEYTADLTHDGQPHLTHDRQRLASHG